MMIYYIDTDAHQWMHTRENARHYHSFDNNKISQTKKKCDKINFDC